MWLGNAAALLFLFLLVFHRLVNVVECFVNHGRLGSVTRPDLSMSFKLRPSEVSPGDYVAPKFHVFGSLFDSNTPHIIYPGPAEADTLVVLVSGTGITPSISENFLSSVSSAHSFPVIGISYIFGPYADTQRNEVIRNRANGNLSMEQEYLENYHNDVLYSGNKSGLVDVPQGSGLISRLSCLLSHLASQRPEEEGWSKFTTEQGLPRWEKLLLVGYSQGAGHLLYLATIEKCRGLILISGPQEIAHTGADTKGWMGNKDIYKTRNIVAFKHARDETGHLMHDNWLCIDPLRLNEEGRCDEEVQEKLGDSAVSMEVTRLGVGGRCFHVDVEPNPDNPYPRPFHCSMMCDISLPDGPPGLDPPKLYFHTLFPFMIEKALSSPIDALPSSRL